MKDFPETFKKIGITYRLVHKAATHPYCIYSAEMDLFVGGFDKKASIIAYEVHKMHWHDACSVMGRDFTEGWSMAGTASFGKLAWSSPTLEGAHEILQRREEFLRNKAEQQDQKEAVA